MLCYTGVLVQWRVTWNGQYSNVNPMCSTGLTNASKHSLQCIVSNNLDTFWFTPNLLWSMTLSYVPNVHILQMIHIGSYWMMTDTSLTHIWRQSLATSFSVAGLGSVHSQTINFLWQHFLIKHCHLTKTQAVVCKQPSFAAANVPA